MPAKFLKSKTQERIAIPDFCGHFCFGRTFKIPAASRPQRFFTKIILVKKIFGVLRWLAGLLIGPTFSPNIGPKAAKTVVDFCFPGKEAQRAPDRIAGPGKCWTMPPPGAFLFLVSQGLRPDSALPVAFGSLRFPFAERAAWIGGRCFGFAWCWRWLRKRKRTKCCEILAHSKS